MTITALGAMPRRLAFFRKIGAPAQVGGIANDNVVINGSSALGNTTLVAGDVSSLAP
jgi:hypothetical protein